MQFHIFYISIFYISIFPYRAIYFLVKCILLENTNTFFPLFIYLGDLMFNKVLPHGTQRLWRTAREPIAVASPDA